MAYGLAQCFILQQSKIRSLTSSQFHHNSNVIIKRISQSWVLRVSPSQKLWICLLTKKPQPTEKVAILTTDGKYLVGKLEGYDHLTNLILSSAQERIISSVTDDDGSIEDLGLYVIRGDLVCCVGEIEETIDKEVKWEKVRGQSLVKTKAAIK